MKVTISSIFFIALGCLIQLYRLLPEDWIHQLENKIPKINLISISLSMLLIIYGGCAAISAVIRSNKYSVFASPESVKVRSQTRKDFKLKVTNNNDFPLYDLQLQICIQRGDLKLSGIDVLPTEKEQVGSPITMIALDINGNDGKLYREILFNNISAHSTKEFFTKVDCINCKENAQVTFRISKWSNSPSGFSFPISKEQFEKGFPKNFNDFFKKDDTKK